MEGCVVGCEDGCDDGCDDGCITHLQSGTATPVRHWVEALDAALRA